MAMMNRTFELKGRHVLAGLLAFFGIVLAANLVYVYLALDSFRGVTTPAAYRQGLAYNETIAAGRVQQATGWQVALSATPAAAGAVVLDAAVSDADGAPVRGLSLGGNLRHPVDHQLDRAVRFEETADGGYRTEVVLPTRGQWDAVLKAERDHMVVYRLEQRLWLK